VVCSITFSISGFKEITCFRACAVLWYSSISFGRFTIHSHKL